MDAPLIFFVYVVLALGSAISILRQKQPRKAVIYLLAHLSLTAALTFLLGTQEQLAVQHLLFPLTLIAMFIISRKHVIFSKHQDSHSKLGKLEYLSLGFLVCGLMFFYIAGFQALNFGSKALTRTQMPNSFSLEVPNRNQLDLGSPLLLIIILGLLSILIHQLMVKASNQD